jgi:hypothetical protein
MTNEASHEKMDFSFPDGWAKIVIDKTSSNTDTEELSTS